MEITPLILKIFLISLVFIWKVTVTEEELSNNTIPFGKITIQRGCISDDNCPPYSYCGNTTNKCHCRFDVEEWDAATDEPNKCRPPPSCVYDNDCSANEMCNAWKCECKDGYHSESNVCRTPNWCVVDENCRHNFTICVKGNCKCKEGFPLYDKVGLLTHCDTYGQTKCTSDINCTKTEQCAEGHCRCKLGAVQGASGRHYCKSINYCEVDEECRFAAGYCNQEKRTCACAVGIPTEYLNGKVYKCETDCIIIGFIVLCVLLLVAGLAFLAWQGCSG